MRKLRAKGDRTKAIPSRYADPFRKRLAQWVNDSPVNQTDTAKKLGMSQPHLSALISGRRSLGLSVLLELYEQTGITPNEWLGLTSPHPSADEDPNAKLVSAVVSGVAELIARQKGRDDAKDTLPLLPPAEHDRVRRGLQGK